MQRLKATHATFCTEFEKHVQEGTEMNDALRLAFALYRRAYMELPRHAFVSTETMQILDMHRKTIQLAHQCGL